MTQDLPSFHDGYLSGIVLKQKDAVVNLQRSDGSQYELTLCGLKSLQVENFRDGNIVFCLEVITGTAPNAVVRDEAMRRLFPAPHPSAAANYQQAYAAFIESQLANLARGEAVLVIIRSSYGADLMAFCESTQLHRSSDG